MQIALKIFPLLGECTQKKYLHSEHHIVYFLHKVIYSDRHTDSWCLTIGGEEGCKLNPFIWLGEWIHPLLHASVCNAKLIRSLKFKMC